MANNMALDVIVRMKDLLSGPARAIGRALEGIGRAAKAIGVLGTAIAGISFLGPIKEAAAFQQQLVDIALTQNLTGQEAFKSVARMTEQYEKLAFSVGQSSEAIGAGAGLMIASGLDNNLVDQSIGKVAKVATAAHAEIADVAQVSTSALKTLKLPVEELEGALAAMMVSGKEGAFEFRDMARHFPTLTGQMAKFGITGREAVNTLAAGLQIARLGTADSAEAANNFKNFLSKILSPETTKKFEKMGVDIEGVMKDAATKGINPMEAVVQKITKLTGVSSDEIQGLMKRAKANGLNDADALAQVREQLEKIHGAGKLGELFGDQQVMDFLIPFLANIDEYKRIKAEVAKATGETINGDFETQMQALNQQLTIFSEIGTQAVREVGRAFGTWLPMINEWLGGMLRSYREWDKASGGMGTKLLTWAGAAVVAVAGLGALGVVLPVIGAGLSALVPLLGPAGLLVAAIGAAGYAVYKNWSTVGPALKRFWDAGVKAGDKLLQSARSLASQYGPMIKRGLVGAWEAASTGMASVFQIVRAAGDKFGPVIKDGLLSAWKDVKAGFRELEEAFRAFSSAVNIKIDTSSWTVNNATVAAFRAVASALDMIKVAWNALKSFGSGFAESLTPIGVNLGKHVTNITRFASALGRIALAVSRLVGFKGGDFDGLFKGLGQLAGKAVEKVTDLMGRLAGYLANVAEGLATVMEAASGGISWTSLLPQSAVALWNEFTSTIERMKSAIAGVPDVMNRLATSVVDAAKGLPAKFMPVINDLISTVEEGFRSVGQRAGEALVEAVKAAVDGLVTWFASLPDRIVAAIGSIDLTKVITLPKLPPWLGGSVTTTATEGASSEPANQNQPTFPSRAAMPGSPAVAAVPAQPQTVKVANDIQLNSDFNAKIDFKANVPGNASVTSAPVKSTAAPASTGKIVGRF